MSAPPGAPGPRGKTNNEPEQPPSDAFSSRTTAPPVHSRFAPANDRVGLASETFTLHLDKLIKYSGQGPISVDLKFHYYWDFVRNMGLAQLLAGDGDINPPFPIEMNPAGIEHTLSFMGANWTQPAKFGDFEETVYRVWLIINLKTGKRSASIMLGKEGDLIIATENDEDEVVGKVLAHTGTVESLEL